VYPSFCNSYSITIENFFFTWFQVSASGSFISPVITTPKSSVGYLSLIVSFCNDCLATKSEYPRRNVWRIWCKITPSTYALNVHKLSLTFPTSCLSTRCVNVQNLLAAMLSLDRWKLFFPLTISKFIKQNWFSYKSLPKSFEKSNLL